MLWTEAKIGWSNAWYDCTRLIQRWGHFCISIGAYKAIWAAVPLNLQPHCARPTLFCPEFCLLTAWNKFGSLRVSAINFFSPIWLPNQNHYFLGALGTPVLPNLYITAKIGNNFFWIGNHPPPPAGLHCLSNSLCLLAHFAPGCPACFSLGSSWQLIVLLSLVRRRQRLQRAQLTGRQINWE